MSHAPWHRKPRWRHFAIRRFWLILPSLLTLLCLMVLVGLLEIFQISPRLLAAHLERSSSLGETLAHALRQIERGPQIPATIYPFWIGATTQATPLPAGIRRIVSIHSSTQAYIAIRQARPGDVLEFQPGTYRFIGQAIPVTQAGSETQPIIVRAAQPGSVLLEFDLNEGFWVNAPYWIFENLSIRGICDNDSRCEHAFHIVGQGHHFIARNNTLHNFNAHFKINGTLNRSEHQPNKNAYFPDHGRIENNTLTNDHARRTDHSVTLIDLLAASHWRIEGNLIADFIKQGGDHISYGAFAKGAGTDNHFHRNVILCTHRLRGQSGQQVGLSLGGGGSSPRYCRDQACVTEQRDSILSHNLIMSCSDDGIYLNRAAHSIVQHNTLLDTAGLSLRFATTDAVIQGNLIDGTLRTYRGAQLEKADNLLSNTTRLYLGQHPIQTQFINPQPNVLDLRWHSPPPRRTVHLPSPLNPATVRDLCGRPQQPTAYGAFEDFSDCLSALAQRAPPTAFQSTLP